MSVKLCLEFVSLKGGCTGSSESTLVKMCHCWNIGFEPMRRIRWVQSYLKEKEKFGQVPQILFFMHAVRCFMLEFIEIVSFFMQTHEKVTQLGNFVFCAKSAFVRQSHRVLPES